MSVSRDWWKEAVVYQIYPWSFNDSNGDGIGDLPGIVEKLDYLDDLGVDVVWLTPVYESPKVDNGYDISDYRSILPEFGTMDDWERLRDGLHARDMKLIMDIAVNHTSDEHEWFQRARGSRDSDYRDYYIWQDGDPGEPPNNWESHFGGSVWEYDEQTGAYYLHLYHRRQPDLNWTNPAVREEMYDVMRWWLDRGIDGFRLDVVNLLSKPMDFPDGNTDADWTGAEHFVDGPRIHEYLREMNERVFSDYDCMTVGEMPALTLDTAREYVGEDGPLDMAFHFDLMKLDFGEAGRWDVGEWTVPDLKETVARWQEGLAGEGWNTLFLNNHDQPRSVSRFGDDERYRVESAKLLATMLLTLQGTPYVYQGEEIGMTNAPFESVDSLRDVDTIQHVELLLAEQEGATYEDIRHIVSHRSRDNARTPVQWSDEPNAGFTDGEPWIPVNPNYPEINVEAARTDPDSVWHHYRDLIELRAEYPVFVYGEFELLLPDHGQLFAYRRTSDDRTGHVVLNLSDDSAWLESSVATELTDAELLLGTHDVPTEPPESHELEPYEARVYLH